MSALFAVLFLFAALYSLFERKCRKTIQAANTRLGAMVERERATTFNMRLRAEREKLRADDAGRRLAELSRSVVPTDEEINRWLECAGR